MRTIIIAVLFLAGSIPAEARRHHRHHRHERVVEVREVIHVVRKPAVCAPTSQPQDLAEWQWPGPWVRARGFVEPDWWRL